jgi:CRP-like cAMP-binding protein
MFASETMFPGAFRAYSADLTHLRRHLREVPIEQGEMLEEPGHPVEAVYFPQTGMISLIVQMPEDSSVEVGTVGSEGALGMAVGLGSRVSFICALVQVSGTALCIPTSAFRAAAGQSGRIRDLIVRHSSATAGRAARYRLAANVPVVDEGRGPEPAK